MSPISNRITIEQSKNFVDIERIPPNNPSI